MGSGRGRCAVARPKSFAGGCLWPPRRLAKDAIVVVRNDIVFLTRVAEERPVFRRDLRWCETGLSGLSGWLG